MGDKEKIVDEHFWFTATTLAVNGYLIATNTPPQYNALTKITSTLISLYAIFLIIHRSAALADKIQMPESIRRIPERDKSFIHKGKETWVHIKLVPKHLVFVIFEFSGAFFYLLLVLVSCVAVWLIK
jgi:hypothetical protein